MLYWTEQFEFEKIVQPLKNFIEISTVIVMLNSKLLFKLFTAMKMEKS